MLLPFVSVLIVVRNEKDYIRNCVDSLVHQEYPRENMEFLLIDGCSEDGTYALLLQEVERLKDQGYAARLLVNEKRILASGWNLGIREARGEYVCRIDAHSEIVPSYISTGIKCLLRPENERVAAVGGWWNHAATTRTGHVIAALLSSKFAVGNSPFRRRPSAISKTDTAVYGVYHRSIFSEVGYFNERLARNQDMVIHHQMKAAGYTFLTHPDMEITYYVRSTVGRLVKKAFGDGQWVALAGSEYFSLRHLVPSLFVLYLSILLITFTLSLFLYNSFMEKIMIMLMSSPIIGYCGLSIYYAMKTPSAFIKRFLLIPLFFVFHTAYGIGTIWGYCQKVRRCPNFADGVS